MTQTNLFSKKYKVEDENNDIKNHLFFRDFLTQKVNILDFLLVNGDIDNYWYDELKGVFFPNNANVLISFPGIIKTLYNSLFDFNDIEDLLPLFEENLDFILEEKVIKQDKIFEFYNKNNEIKENILTKELFFKKLKCLFFDDDLNNKELKIRLDILGLLLYFYSKFIKNFTKYSNTFLYTIISGFFGDSDDKALFGKVIKFKAKSKTESFLFILENYDSFFDENRLLKIKKTLKPGFLINLKDKVNSNTIDINYVFGRDKFKSFVNDNIEDFQIGLLNGVFYFNYFTFVIREDFYNSFLKKAEKPLIKVAEKSLNYNFSINEDIFTDKYKIKSYKIYEFFYETININKKSILTTKTELNTILKQLDCLDMNSIDNTIKNILVDNLKSLINYKKYLGQTITNLSYRNEEDFDDIEKFDFGESLSRNYEIYKDDFINYESFKELVFVKNQELAKTLYMNSKYLYNSLANKIGEYNITENTLFNNLIVELAKLGIIEVYGYKKGLFYYDNYSYWNNKEECKYLEIKYIRFKKLSKKIEANNLPNYISGNTIYLNLNTDLKHFKKISKFSILEGINQYITLKLTRDTLIKAKNKYEITSKEVFSFLKKDLKLDVPKNIEMMLSDVDNKKDDILIMKSGIPIIINEEGIYNDIIKLKMFSKNILYKDHKIGLIIFSDKFRSLENLLTKRNIIFKKV